MRPDHGNPLNHIRIVLVDTKTPGNIGFVCRCMMNMGLSRLVLVRPPKDPHGEAEKTAAGADPILRSAMKFAELRDAVDDCALVVGTSRHIARRRTNIGAPREQVQKILPVAQSNMAAVVFGGEVNGLNNEDLARCHELIAIPAAEAFPSLNLSHAVMIIGYELYLAAGAALPLPERPLAPSRETENLYTHLQRTLERINFLDPAASDHLMRALRQLFGRARLDQREVGILRGILTQVDKLKLRADDEPGTLAS